ncbi:MAG: Gfo/Idh/MocA family oxidoreductase [Alphaproteobacteria bacterium]
MADVRVAILGAGGWMGKVHSLGYRNTALLFGGRRGSAEIAMLVDENAGRLKEMAAAIGNPRIESDWRVAVADPDIDLIDICLPDYLHYPVAKAALEAGKNVYCEKPFTDTAAEAKELADLATRKGVVTRIGHNFPKNPAHEIARDLIRSGEIGDIQLFRAWMHVDVLADPAAPFMWRCDGELAPTGAVGDIATHVFSLVDYLVGDIRTLTADAGVTAAERPYQAGFGYGVKAGELKDAPMKAVTNPDFVNILCRLKNGGRGVIDVSRVATGRRFQQGYDIYGTRGALSFDYDEVNRIRFYSGADPVGRQGWRAIDAGPESETYAAFNPVANFGVGYNEFKAIEVSEVVNAVATGTPVWPTFHDGARLMRIVDACLKSAAEGGWVTVEGGNA